MTARGSFATMATLGQGERASPQAPAAPRATATTISADPNGPKITVGTDGKMTVIAPDGSTTILGPDGKVLTHISNDGEVSQPSANGTVVKQGLDDGGVVALLAVNVFLAFFLGRWWTARKYKRRGVIPSTAIAGLPENLGERMERIEHAVESVAIEVERISEGQRFTTKLMSEMRPAGAQLPGAAPAEGAPVRRAEPAAAVPVSDRRS